MPHATATFNGKVIAEADKWEFVEGNVYVIMLLAVDNTPGLQVQFPPDSVDKSVLSDSTLTTVCPWKGTASYYNISVDGMR